MLESEGEIRLVLFETPEKSYRLLLFNQLSTKIFHDPHKKLMLANAFYHFLKKITDII